jgi:hypothetical protein
MTRKEFYVAWFSRAVSKPFRLWEITGLVLTAPFGILSFLKPGWGGVMGTLLWLIPLMVFLGTFVAAWLHAPYAMYRELEVLREAEMSRVQTGSIEILEEILFDDKTNIYQLQIHSSLLAPVTFSALLEHKEPDPGGPFPINLRFVGRPGQLETDIAPGDTIKADAFRFRREAKKIEIIQNDGSAFPTGVRKKLLLKFCVKYGQIATRKTFELFVNETGKLIITPAGK